MPQQTLWVGVKLLLAWLAITLTIWFVSIIVGVQLRNQMVAQLEAQIEASAKQLKTLEAQNVVLKEQAMNSMNDRAYIHGEVESNKKYAAGLVNKLNEMESALKRLEARK